MKKTTNQVSGSSCVKGVKYCAKQSELFIEFTSGSQYCYDKVSKPLYNDFINASSKGQYYCQHIKGKFVCRKISD